MIDWNTLYQRAYVPYSGNPKACIIKGKSGNLYPGVRLENISFPLTIPAIQAACSFCLSTDDEPATLILRDDTELEQQEFWTKEFDLSVEILTDIADLKLISLKHIRTSNDDRVELEELFNKAKATNSDFPVSALLETETGDEYSGVNIEVSGWTNGICAERVAIAKAVTDGNRKFKTMCLSTKKGDFNSPCGACRQVIYEHLPNHPMKFYHKDGTQSAHFSNHLLPFGFTSNSLNK